MNAVQRRIKTLRLLEKMEKNPELAKELGLEKATYSKNEETKSEYANK